MLWGVGLIFRLFEETLLKISLRYHKRGNGFYALVFILVPDTPQLMRFPASVYVINCNVI